MRRRQRNILLLTVVSTLIMAPWGDGGNPQPGQARASAPSEALPKMMTTETVKAIDKGLEYLKRTQRTDGSWFSGYGYYEYPAVMTSLGGLAFMASGSTPETGLYYKQVKKAMFYILRLAEGGRDGLICGPTGESRSMYGHGFSMLFLAQCYGMDMDKATGERIRKVLDKAVALTAKSQSTQGGWIYTPTQNSDEGSVTVTQLQALRACRNVGIKVPASTITRAVEYLKKCQMSDGGIRYSFRSRGASRPAISAAAIACFYAAGVYDRRSGRLGKESQMIEKLVAYCKRNINVNRSGGHYFYTHFYMAQAMYQRGRADWQDYYPRIRDRLMKLQNVDGSWMGDNVGTTYGTALAAIILQLPYGYLPIYQK